MLTVALATIEFAGALADSALPMLPDDIASVNCVARASAKLLASLDPLSMMDMSNEIAVNPVSRRRPEYAAAIMLLICSWDVTLESVSTREAAKAICES